MPPKPQHPVTDPLDMHRRYWSEGIDLDIVALVLALHRAREAVMAPGRETWARHGLTPAEFDVLATLRRSPPPWQLTPTEVQSLLFITSGGLTKLMARLEARRLVTRPQHTADQRVRPVRLTAQGKRLVEQAMAELMADSASAVRSALTTGEIVALTATLARLAAVPGG